MTRVRAVPGASAGLVLAFTAVLLTATAVVTAATSGAEDHLDEDTTSDISMVNAIEVAVDVYVDQELALAGAGSTTVSGPLALEAATYGVHVYEAQMDPPADDGDRTDTPMVTTAMDVSAGRDASLVVHPDAVGATTLTLFGHDMTPAPKGRARLSVHNVASGAAVEVVLINTIPIGSGTSVELTYELSAALANGQEDATEWDLRDQPSTSTFAFAGFGPDDLGLEMGQNTMAFIVDGPAPGDLAVLTAHLEVGETTFPDVPYAHPFHHEIEWLAASGITGGYDDGSYRPGADVTRQAMAAFLHRLAGEPPVPTGAPTFPDVGPSHPFRDAIRWLAAEGITTGYADGTFRPSADISRQAMGAFLHRMAGEPAPPPGAPTFPDVGADNPFHAAIGWMAAEEITTGFPDGTFRPLASVTRQAMAAFIARYAANVIGGA